MRVIAVLAVAFVSSVHGQTGVISTVAGLTVPGGEPQRGFSGDGGPAARASLTLAGIQNECDPARFEEMSHISVDRAGNILIADTNNNRIRRIGMDGVISTIAGSGERPSLNNCSPLGGGQAAGDGGQALSARLYGPAQAIALENGNLLICDQKNNRIRQVTPQGQISTIVGSNLHAFYAPNILATLSPMDWPSSIAVDREGRLYFAEIHSHRIARVNGDGRTQTIAGTGLPGLGADGGDATRSALANPAFLLFDREGNLLIADQGNHRIRRLRASGAIDTVAGTGAPGFSGDGSAATAAQLSRPNGLALDSRGNLYIADMGNHRIRRVTPDGVISTVAGNGQIGRGADGVPATQSALNFPSSVAVDAAGDLLVVDWQNYLVRKVSFSARPAISPGGVVNAASFLPAPVPLAPGALISVFGVNFAGALSQASELPLPTELGGVSVSVNGRRIPLVFASSGQVNAQLPYDLREGAARVQVSNAQGVSTEETVNIGAAAPGIFTIAGTQRAVAVNQDFSLNTPDNPESRGRVITVYCTGIGPLDGELEAGRPAPSNTLFRAALDSSAAIAGRDAPMLFLGLTPGFVGLAQANIQLPADLPVGNALELVVSVNRQRSNTAQVAVR
ncbi:MAG: hypothetical protein FJW30_23610 [Acidobacteria bacterium]|nr:hypothetical protein [Acidobacteriota bacterium]